MGDGSDEEGGVRSVQRGTGHKRGERHHRSRYPNTIVERARTLHARGYGYQATAEAIAEESAYKPSWRTVADWVRGDIRVAA